MSSEEFKPDWRVPPGETISELAESRQMTLAQVATSLGISAVRCARLLRGEELLTDEIAARLEDTFNVKQQMWIDLEADYRKPLE